MFLMAALPELTRIDAVVAVDAIYSQLAPCVGFLQSADTEGALLCFQQRPEGWGLSHDGSRQSGIGAALFGEILHPLGDVATRREVAASAGLFARPAVGEECI
jgi:hypothetical protein